jgi:hypothetical protein
MIIPSFLGRTLTAVLACTSCVASLAQQPVGPASAASAAGPSQPAAGAGGAPNLPGDNGAFRDDHLRFPVTISGLVSMAADAPAGVTYCAPKGSRVTVTAEDDKDIYVRFLSVTDETDFLKATSDEQSLQGCPKPRRVNGFTIYRMAKERLKLIDYKRSGVSFGGLVVPFKYRLGSAKQLVSSSTIAPFIGFRTAMLQDFGLTFTPLVAAGLSLVPVADADGKSTSSRSAYTFAVGLRLTSSKNESFSAGLLFGRDFLNKADREADPSVKKPWLSFYVGASI